MTRDRFKESDMHNKCLQLIGSRSTNNREQNMAICYEVYAIIVGDFRNENIHNFQNLLTQKFLALSTHRMDNLLVKPKDIVIMDGSIKTIFFSDY